MKYIILLMFFLNCVNVKNFQNDNLQQNLLASLLGEKDLLNSVANRRVTGQLVNINNEVMKNVEIKNLKINKRNLISKATKTNDNGEFTIDLKTGTINVEIVKDEGKLGDLIFNIQENNPTYVSDNFKINNLKSVYIYPSGYETPIIFVGYSLSNLYYGSRYLNIEFVNVADQEITFVSSSITSKTSGVTINYPYINDDVTSNSVSKKFLGKRMKAGEYRSIYNYMKNFWKYEDTYYDSESFLRYYSPTTLKVNLTYDYGKTQYFQIITDSTITTGSIANFEIIFTQSNGTVSTIPFQITF